MNTPPILIVPTKSCKPADLRVTRKSGIVVIETSDPEKVRYVDPPLAKGNLARVAEMIARDLMTGKISHVDRDVVQKRLANFIMQAETPAEPARPEGARPCP